MKNRISVGLSSIIFIFYLLCLSVFCLLSISDAKTSLDFSERRAAAVQSYYAADAAGQRFLLAAAQALKAGQSAEEAAKTASMALPEKYFAQAQAENSGQIVCDIPMPAGQSLHIELNGTDAFVQSYYVYNSENYEIDSRLPVWDGTP